MNSEDLKEILLNFASLSTEKATELYNLAKEMDLLNFLSDLWMSMSHVSTAMTAVKTIQTVNQWFFKRKVQIFQEQLQSYDQEKFKYNWNNIELKKRITIITQLLIQLDRANILDKARIYAETIRARVENRITPEQFDYIMYSIEMVHPMGFNLIKIYYDYFISYEAAKNMGGDTRSIWAAHAGIDFSLLSSTGFLKLPTGASMTGSLGGAFISDFGKVFYKEILCYVKNE